MTEQNNVCVCMYVCVCVCVCTCIYKVSKELEKKAKEQPTYLEVGKSAGTRRSRSSPRPGSGQVHQSPGIEWGRLIPPT